MDAPPITLGREEQRRLYVLDELTAGRLTTIEAALALDVSIRHLQRLKARYQREGIAALSHGNRGRRPWNAISDDLAGQVVELARTCSGGVNHSHLADLLAEHEGITLSLLGAIIEDKGIPSRSPSTATESSPSGHPSA